MKRRAFTLIELVMVIVVLGIVTMIGTNIIAHMYEGYIRSKVINKLQADTEQVLDIISKRLQYRIKDSVVASNRGANYLKLSDPSISINHDVLEWIGYDNEGMIGEWVTTGGINRFAGWSGFIDIDNASTNSNGFVTSGSRLDKTKIDIDNLSYGGVNLNNNGGGAAIVFKCSHNSSVKSYGYLNNTHTNVYPVHKTTNTQLVFDTPPGSVDYCEHYYLAWSAYAIVPENVVNAKDGNGNDLFDKSTPPKHIKDFDLYLYYNYQPWQNERYSNHNTKKALLSKHVSTFRFVQTGSTIRAKLCLRDEKTNYGFCKERAIY